jgi:hypothetical protein
MVVTAILQWGDHRRQHLGRDPALGFRDPFSDQLGRRIVIVGPLDPRWCGPRDSNFSTTLLTVHG